MGSQGVSYPAQLLRAEPQPSHSGSYSEGCPASKDEPSASPAASASARPLKPLSVVSLVQEGCASQLLASVYLCCCSVTKPWPTLCDSVDCSMPGFPVRHYLPEFAQVHVHLVSDAIQPSHPLLSPSPPAFNLSQYQGLFQWVSSLHQVAKVLEFQVQHQSFQWIFRTDFL